MPGLLSIKCCWEECTKGHIFYILFCWEKLGLTYRHFQNPLHFTFHCNDFITQYFSVSTYNIPIVRTLSIVIIRLSTDYIIKCTVTYMCLALCTQLLVVRGMYPIWSYVSSSMKLVGYISPFKNSALYHFNICNHFSTLYMYIFLSLYYINSLVLTLIKISTSWSGVVDNFLTYKSNLY